MDRFNQKRFSSASVRENVLGCCEDSNMGRFNDHGQVISYERFGDTKALP